MMDKDYNIDRLFREGIQHSTVKAPVGAWDSLNADLASGFRKKRFILIRRIAAVAIIFIAFGAGYFFAVYQGNNSYLISQTNNNSEMHSPARDTEFPELSGNISPLGYVAKINVNSKSSDLENSSLLKKDKDYRVSVGVNDNAEFPNNNNLSNLNQSGVAFVEIYESSSESINSIGTRSDYQLLVINKVDVIEENTYEFEYGNSSDSFSRRWSIGAHFAPVYAYRDISSEYGVDQVNTLAAIDEYNRVEEPLLSYAGGMDLKLDFSKHWSIQSGVYFSRIGQVNTDALVYEEADSKLRLYSINTSTGDLAIDIDKIPENVRSINPPKDGEENDVNVRVIQNFDLFEIPLHMKYRLLSKKVTLELSGGLSPAFLLDNTTVVEIENEKLDIGDTPNLNQFFVNSMVGFGLGYQINKKLSFTVEPVFKYALSPINRNSQLDVHPYYMNWFTGLTYSF